MTDPVKRAEELKRYHIGEQTSDTTIQPRGEPIESPNGWWYPSDEAGDVIRALCAEVKALREERDLARSFLEDEQKKSADWWTAYCTMKEEHEGIEDELTSLRGVVEKVREHTTKRLSDPPCSVYQEGKHDEAKPHPLPSPQGDMTPHVQGGGEGTIHQRRVLWAIMQPITLNLHLVVTPMRDSRR